MIVVVSGRLEELSTGEPAPRICCARGRLDGPFSIGVGRAATALLLVP